MKIFLLYKNTDNPWGGINTFFRNFEKFAEYSKEIEITPDSSNSALILSAGHYYAPGKLLKRYYLQNLKSGRSIHNPLGFFMKNGNKKIVFRVDGLRLFYAQNMSMADKTLIRNLELADSVIFQSNYCQKCFDDLKIPYPQNNCIIHNGTNSNFFYPASTVPDFSPRVIFISNCWSTNEKKGFETIALFSELKNTRILHIGQWPKNIPSKSVELLGTLKEQDVADILRMGHFLLFPSKNEACPNVVIEALSCGLPVLYDHSGGTPEICHNGRFGMPLPENVKNPQVIEAFLNEAIEGFESLRQGITSNLSLFSFERCFESYLRFFKETENS